MGIPLHNNRRSNTTPSTQPKKRPRLLSPNGDSHPLHVSYASPEVTNDNDETWFWSRYNLGSDEQNENENDNDNDNESRRESSYVPPPSTDLNLRSYFFPEERASRSSLNLNLGLDPPAPYFANSGTSLRRTRSIHRGDRTRYSRGISPGTVVPPEMERDNTVLSPPIVRWSPWNSTLDLSSLSNERRREEGEEGGGGGGGEGRGGENRNGRIREREGEEEGEGDGQGQPVTATTTTTTPTTIERLPTNIQSSLPTTAVTPSSAITASSVNSSNTTLSLSPALASSTTSSTIPTSTNRNPDNYIRFVNRNRFISTRRNSLLNDGDLERETERNSLPDATPLTNPTPPVALNDLIRSRQRRNDRLLSDTPSSSTSSYFRPYIISATTNSNDNGQTIQFRRQRPQVHFTNPVSDLTTPHGSRLRRIPSPAPSSLQDNDRVSIEESNGNINGNSNISNSISARPSAAGSTIITPTNSTTSHRRRLTILLRSLTRANRAAENLEYNQNHDRSSTDNSPDDSGSLNEDLEHLLSDNNDIPSNSTRFSLLPGARFPNHRPTPPGDWIRPDSIPQRPIVSIDRRVTPSSTALVDDEPIPVRLGSGSRSSSATSVAGRRAYR